MRKVPAKYLAWLLWTVFMGLLASIILIQHFFIPALATDLLMTDLAIVAAFAAMATTGTVIVSKYPSNPIGWLLLVSPLAASAASAAELYAQYAVNFRPGALPGGGVAGLVSNALWIVFLAPMTFLLLLFPGKAKCLGFGAARPRRDLMDQSLVSFQVLSGL